MGRIVMWLSGSAKRVVWYTSRLYSPYIQSGTAQLPRDAQGRDRKMRSLHRQRPERRHQPQEKYLKSTKKAKARMAREGTTGDKWSLWGCDIP